jgi:hypothetical protein
LVFFWYFNHVAMSKSAFAIGQQNTVADLNALDGCGVKTFIACQPDVFTCTSVDQLFSAHVK